MAADHPLVPIAGLPTPASNLPVDSHFALIGLTQSRAKLAVIAHALLCKTPSHYMTEIDGGNWHVATFEDRQDDLNVLKELIVIVGSLKTAIVYVRGRYYAPGQHTRLYQWLTCYTRMRGMDAPLSMCDYMTDRIYRLEQDEVPRGFVFGPGAGPQYMPEQAVSDDPRLREKYRLPCSLLGSFSARQLDRYNEAGGREQLEAFAEKEGLDRCPRYVAERMLRLR